jgi:hypothetical protein
MSAGLGGGGSATAPGSDPIAPLAADPVKTNKLIDLPWIACGKDDAAMKGAGPCTRRHRARFFFDRLGGDAPFRLRVATSTRVT